MAYQNFLLSYKHSNAWRTVFCAMIVSLVLAAHPATAQEGQDLYLIENIRVDVTSDNAVNAREKAFEAAQIKGYEALAKRVLSPEELEAFETPDLDSISAYVMDYEVSNEKLSSVRYNGVYQIRFSEDAFASAQQANQQIVAYQKGGVLVLPFIQSGSKAGARSFLWQVNPLMDAWKSEQSLSQSNHVILPAGDVDDVTQIRGDQGLNYDQSRLNAMRLRYSADSAKILYAQTRGDATHQQMIVDVDLYDARTYGPELDKRLSYKSYPGEVESQFYRRVVQSLIPVLSPTSQGQVPVLTQNPISTDKANTITARIDFASMQDWIGIKNALQETPAIQNIQIKSLTPAMAVIDLRYAGQIESLRQILRQKSLKLNNPNLSDANAQNDIYSIQRDQTGGRY